MNAWILIQILVNIILMVGLGAVWVRLNRPAKDDPRMSKGLQLLQSKISILEDLSDRTDTQVQQLTALLENKCKEIQEKITEADQQLNKIDRSLRKSLEVTEIFQDRIPHQEIIERRNTIKYVKAAKMAHQGRSIDEIAQAVDLSRGEIELIATVNKDQLMFAEESLPSWAVPRPDVNETTPTQPEPSDQGMFHQQLPREIPMNFERAFDFPQTDQDALKKLGEKFKQAESVSQQPAAAPSVETVVQNGKTFHVKPFEFKKVDLNGNLA